MHDDFVYHQGKRPNRTYLSKTFCGPNIGASSRRVRFISKVFDSGEHRECAVDGQEIIVKRTDGGRQEVKALFYEDDRAISRLVILRYSTITGKLAKVQFSFNGEEISSLYQMLQLIQHVRLAQDTKIRIDNQYLDEFLDEDDSLLSLLERNKTRLAQLDTVDLRRFLEFSERTQQLAVFERLLTDATYFQETQCLWNANGPEAVWQRFFEQNPWVFGLGLAPIFMEAFNPEKLENVIAGHSITSRGKRVDALLRTTGVMSSICLAEIKTHNTSLLKLGGQYRPDVWSVSDEVTGGVSQCQRTAQRASQHLATRLQLEDSNGNPLSREAFNYQPRTYLIVGSLAEFVTSQGPNESKFSSFELYRRNLKSPAIITFDELLARAKATVTLQAG